MVIGPAADQAEGDAPDEIAEIKNVKISLTLHAVADMLTGLTVSSLTNSPIRVFTSLGPVIDTFRPAIICLGELGLGELVGGTEPGILEIMAKLANRVFSK